MKNAHATRGFTLVEVLVAVVIVAILASVVMFNIQEGKKKARDTQRVSDLGQFQLALRIYKDSEGAYPVGSLNESDLNTELGEYLTGEITDPLSPDAGYAYHFDDAYDCDGSSRTVLYAETMEREGASNHDVLCGTDGSKAYILILK